MQVLSFVIALSLASASHAQISAEKKSQLEIELRAIANLFSTQYAPRSWKEKHVSWNVSDELNKSLLIIAQAKTARDYRQALQDFVGSTQDYHVSVRFYSTERASLPFEVRTIEGKAIIVEINRDKLPEETFPFSVGDELVLIDGRKTSEISQELIENMGGGNVPGTDLAWSDMYLTVRSGRANMLVPRGPVMLTLLRADEVTPVNFQLAWEYQPEQAPGSVTWNEKVENKTKLKSRLPMMVSTLAQDRESVGESWGIGERTSFMPALGEKLWSSSADSIFDAYTYLNDNGQVIGVIRLPSYTPDDVDAAVKEMGDILTRMQKQTSALVIDQVNNPGGSVFYLYALVSMLTDQAIATPRHRMIISEEVVVSAVADLKSLESIKTDKKAKEELGETLSGYPVTYQMVVNIRNYCQFIIDQWKAGKRLTDPYYIWGVDQINPSSVVQYTKPIVVLVNELDFSGGDFFPATLQDNKRALIVGTRTAGAGGYVGSLEIPNSFGFVGISFTGSIAERIDRNPIENLGVTPDIELKLTVNDIRTNLKSYRAKVKEIVDSLAK